MQNENSIPGNETPAQPSPQLQVTPGLKTTSGQFTAIFTFAALLLSFLGFHYSPAQLEGWVTLIEHFLETLGPLLAIIPVLMTYINSRGKIASNTVNANATIMAQPVTLTAAAGLVADHDGLSGILGGADWKDPDRYENLINLASQLGVPGADKVDKINQQVHPAQIFKGILSMLHKKKGA